MQNKPDENGPVQPSMIIMLIRFTVVYLIFLLTLWVLAWDLQWWQGWIYSFLFLIAGIGGRLWAEWRHPGLLAERQNLDKMQHAKSWDKILAPLAAASVTLPLFVVAGLDHRYNWSQAFPVWICMAGLLLVTVGYAFSVWALVENRYFSSVVRIQIERGHTVCDTGPYRILRHPGYAGHVLALPGVALALGSLWTFVPVVVALVVLVIRTALEDQTLQKELPGYSEYTQRVRFRLVPGIY